MTIEELRATLTAEQQELIVRLPDRVIYRAPQGTIEYAIDAEGNLTVCHDERPSRLAIAAITASLMDARERIAAIEQKLQAIGEDITTLTVLK